MLYITAAEVAEMTIREAARIGVQQYRDGATFAAANVRPLGFFAACCKMERMDLADALDRGWHIANLAEPVELSDGSVIGMSEAQAALEAICKA